LIPLWKVSREIARFGQQLRALPEMLWEPYAQSRHDAAFKAGFAVTGGAVAVGDKVAILLIWQPKGVAASVLATCRHLIDNGYAPFVVSNAALSPGDTAALSQLCWRIMVRPNFGYDFGGYRDGLAQLKRMYGLPKRLVILNDSVWFPLQAGDDTLARMEATDADMVGTVLRVRAEERFLESYFYSIPQRTLEHPAFVRFWDDLRLTSNKYKVIRRGERGFSAALMESGLRLSGLFGRDDFLARIERADADILRDVLRYSASQNRAHLAEAAQLLADNAPGFEGRARGLIARMLEKGQFYSTFPLGAVRLMRYPVLKKSREPVSKNWRSAYLRAVQEGALPEPLPAVMAELKLNI
jgi:hypothetical protein